jgi:O-antigen ligase/polysaccharide polymerase Wzy-like membrane protein
MRISPTSFSDHAWPVVAIASVVASALLVGITLGRGNLIIPLALIALVGAAVLFRFMMGYPPLGLYLAVMFLMFDSRNVPGPVNVSPSNVLLVMTLVAALLNWFGARHQAARINPARIDKVTLVSSTGLLIAAFLSLVAAQFPLTVIRLTITILGALLILWLTQFVITDADRIKQLIEAYIWGAVICSVIGIVQALLAIFAGVYLGIIYTYVGTIMLDLPRVASTWLDPNIFGLYLMPAVPLAWGIPMKQWQKTIVLVLLLVGIGLSYSRTAWVSTAISAWIIWVVSIVRPSRQFSGSFSIPLRWFLVFIVTIMWTAVGLRLGLWDALVDLNRDAFEGRIDMSLAGLKYFESSPLFGIGVGNFLLLSDLFTHNSYLSVLIEYGLIGGLAWFSLLTVTAWRGLKLALQPYRFGLRPLGVVCFSAFSGLLIGGTAIEIENDKFVWLSIALVTILSRPRTVSEDEAVA